MPSRIAARVGLSVSGPSSRPTTDVSLFRPGPHHGARAGDDGCGGVVGRDLRGAAGRL